MKTSELTGAALDWAVAKAEGHDMEYFQVVDSYMPSIDWGQGGPIIENISIDLRHGSTCIAEIDDCGDGQFVEQGPTLLIAAMRCYVKWKLGEDLEIPEGLL